jgi:hypothetical protein
MKSARAHTSAIHFTRPTGYNATMSDEPLRNPRHEKFAQLLFEGLPASRAFVEAGYAANDGNAIRLKGNEKVKARLAFLQSQAAAKTETTLETILADLVDAAAVARSKGQGQALVSAAMAKAKLLGLDVQRIEIGKPGEFEGLETHAEIIDRVLELQAAERFKPIDVHDRERLAALYDRHLREQAAFFDEIQSRPSLASRVDVHRLGDNWRDYEPRTAYTGHKPPRLINGSKTPPRFIEREVRKAPAEE